MSWKKGLLAVAAIMLVLGVVVAFNYKAIILYLATNTGQKIEVAANRPVPWQAGPQTSMPPLTDRPPNIVMIVIDDMGINNVSTFGAGLAPTPNIDALAARGAVLTRGYAGSAVCSPSRAMIMTGRYPTRHGFDTTPTPNGMTRIMQLFFNDGSRPYPLLTREADDAGPDVDFAEKGLPGSEVTIAEVLKPRGYHTVHIGKWHIGEKGASSPNAQGFDESLTLASGLYLPEDDPQVVNAKLDFDPIDQFLWARMQYAASFNGGAPFAPDGYLTDYYTDQARAVIRANRNRPFFLYMAHWGIHTPMQASKADYDALGDIENPRERVLGAMIRSVDRSVGQIMQELRDQGLAENTLVIFTSDNGAPGYLGLPNVNRPYRGWKLTFFEGGLRVPMFISWPGRIAPGTIFETPASHIDLLPTIAGAASAPLPTDRPIDGVDLLPWLKGLTREGLRRPIFWQNGYYKAVLHDGWKLQTSTRPAKDWLYNLNSDPTEQRNLAAARPDKVAELKALIARHEVGARPSLYPYTREMPVMIDKTLEQPANKTDEYIYWPG